MAIVLTGALLTATIVQAQTKPAPKPAPATAAPAQAAALPIARKPWTGDFDAMVKRRIIRVLVPHSKTMYFVEAGQPRGLAYEAFKTFEDELNKKRGPLKVNVVFFPTTREKMVPDLLAGLGDVIAAGFTITADRDKVLDFAIPSNTKPISEIVVTGPQSPNLTTLDDLAGKDVFVRKSSSYWEHLEQLNARFKKEGKAAITLRPAPEDLEDEDLLEMLNAGLFGIAVVDDYKLEIWSKIYPKIKARPDLAVSSGGELAWAFRPNSPQLKTALDAFLKTHRQGTTFGNTLIKRYTGSTKFVLNARSPEEIKKYQTVVDLFRKYAGKYDVDFLLMAAQGYQESRLDQKVKSPVGALGVMQVMPATGKELGRRRRHAARAEHPRGREVHAVHDRSLLRERTDDAARQGPLHVRVLQRGAREGSPAPSGGRAPRARSERLVQQRRDHRRGKDRRGNRHLRQQHLQVLHHVSARDRGHGAAEEAVVVRARPAAAATRW